MPSIFDLLPSTTSNDHAVVRCDTCLTTKTPASGGEEPQRQKRTVVTVRSSARHSSEPPGS